MKKLVLLMFVAAFTVSISSLQAADPKSKKKDKKESVQIKKEQQKLSDEEVQKLIARVEEIDKMDKSTLTAKERRDLRKELRDIKDKVNQNYDGVYIGGGVLLVVIIVLLILLL